MRTCSRLLCAALFASAPLWPAMAAAKPAAKSAKKKNSVSEGGDEAAASAKDKSRIPTLADRIRPVSGKLFVRKGRSELEPEVGLSLNDAFFQKYMFGLKYAYHITDAFSAELGGAFGIGMPSGTVNICTPQGCQTPTMDQLRGTPGDIGLIVGAGASWAPLYGKISLMAEKVLHFDTFFSAGLDGISYKKPVLDLTQSPGGAFTFGGHFGVGQHYVFSQFAALRLDLRDYIYAGQRAVNGKYQGQLENQLMLNIGVSFFFPLHPSQS